jgi:hypothetical protein
MHMLTLPRGTVYKRLALPPSYEYESELLQLTTTSTIVVVPPE